MDAIIAQAPAVTGTLTLPADKAIGHRAAIGCALLEGSTQIDAWPLADDCRATLDALRALGVTARVSHGTLSMRGVGLEGWRAPASELDCRESGTTMRLLCGVLAGQPFVTHLTGAASLRQRPMRRVAEPLWQMGARLESLAPSATGTGNGEIYPPLRITGRRPLHGATFRLPIASAQVKSAILLAGLYADAPTNVIEPAPTRDHTERLLHLLGVSIQCEGSVIHLSPPRSALARPGRLRIPGDVSSAAFFVVAASIVPGSRLELRDVGLNPSRTQYLDVLRRMGAAIRVELSEDSWEPRGTIVVEHRPLRAVHVPPEEVPQVIDELSILWVAACAAEGESRFEGLAELRVKETDRITSMVNGLRQLGARVRVEGADTVCVEPSRLSGQTVDSAGDHRTAMSLAVAGLIAEGRTRIRGAECVSKSLPNFFELLASIADPRCVTTVSAREE